MKPTYTPLLVVLALACRPAEPARNGPPPVPLGQDDASRAPGPVDAGAERTPLPIARAELAARVDALARMSRVESSHIGAAGTASPAWAAFDAVVQTATPSELRALVHHESPVVRGYVGQHLARTDATVDVAALRPLLLDTSPVGTTDGCMMADTKVAVVIAEALAWSPGDKAGAHALLRSIADDPSYPPEVRDLIAKQVPAR